MFNYAIVEEALAWVYPKEALKIKNISVHVHVCANISCFDSLSQKAAEVLVLVPDTHTKVQVLTMISKELQYPFILFWT